MTVTLRVAAFIISSRRTRAFFTRSAKVRSRKTLKGTGMVGPRPFRFSDKRVPVCR